MYKSSVKCTRITRYRNTGYLITITNYLATTASHFTQINKGYPLDKDGGRGGYILRARGGERTAHTALTVTAESRNSCSGTRFPRPIKPSTLTRQSHYRSHVRRFSSVFYRARTHAHHFCISTSYPMGSTSRIKAFQAREYKVYKV